jgi:hypothetical protein
MYLSIDNNVRSKIKFSYRYGLLCMVKHVTTPWSFVCMLPVHPFILSFALGFFPRAASLVTLPSFLGEGKEGGDKAKTRKMRRER